MVMIDHWVAAEYAAFCKQYIADPSPNTLVGVGFISQGFESARPYRRMPDSWHRRANWMFKGIEGEIFGDFGLAHEGAAGIEIDRYDLNLGTPPQTLIVASSMRFQNPENFLAGLGRWRKSNGDSNLASARAGKSKSFPLRQ